MRVLDGVGSIVIDSKSCMSLYCQVFVKKKHLISHNIFPYVKRISVLSYD